MAMEIERKFLVHHSLLPELGKGVSIIQGYLAEKPSVRFRFIDNLMILTVKEYYPAGKRFELETPPQNVTFEEKAKIQELAISPPIVKVRHRIQENGLLWEVDVYQEENLGLITVDVELPSQEYPISFPAWVDKNKEITGDPRYNNLNLGRNPISQWT